ncbi:MAG: molybdenum cofactor guanylyltransferase [Desulfomonilaceae bacterium]
MIQTRDRHDIKKEQVRLKIRDGFGSVSGILLAGGGSRRMGGINKALLEVGGRRIIERAASVLRKVFREVLVITNSPEDFRFLGLPMFTDLLPGRGSLGGLYTGLSACAGIYGFLVACDMPFLSEDVIKYMVDMIDGYDVVLPRTSGGFEPLHAAYSKACLPHIEGLLQREDLKIANFFDKVKVSEVPEADLVRFDPELRFIMNINTPQDLQQARIYVDREGSE